MLKVKIGSQSLEKVQCRGSRKIFFLTTYFCFEIEFRVIAPKRSTILHSEEKKIFHTNFSTCLFSPFNLYVIAQCRFGKNIQINTIFSEFEALRLGIGKYATQKRMAETGNNFTSIR